MLPVVSVVGRSGSGKTMLMEQLIAEFKGRGYRVAALKHTRRPVEIDTPGKDSWRFAQAGSDAVFVSSPGKLAFTKTTDHDLDIQEVIDILGPGFDLILAEGFKEGTTPKIEVHRSELGGDLLCSPADLAAVITDGSLEIGVTQLQWGDVPAIADFIEQAFLSPSLDRAAPRYMRLKRDCPEDADHRRYTNGQ